MRVLPQVLIASLIVSVMGTAMLRAAPPEGMPSPDDTPRQMKSPSRLETGWG